MNIAKTIGQIPFFLIYAQYLKDAYCQVHFAKIQFGLLIQFGKMQIEKNRA